MPRLSSLLDTRIVHCGGFEAAMIRAERTKGFFVSFGYTGDALVDPPLPPTDRPGDRSTDGQRDLGR